MFRSVSPVRISSGLIGFLLLCVWLGGCASQKEITSLQRQIWAARRDLNKSQAQVDELEKKMMAQLQAYDSDNQPLRRNQAAVGAQLERIEVELGRLNGLLEEATAMNDRNGERISQVQQNQMESMLEVRKSVEDLDRRMALMASSLGLQELAVSSTSNVATSKKAGTAVIAAPKVQTASKQPTSDAEELYGKAFQLFRGGQFEAARTEFANYLKRYPDTELADNSQFWLGECYYAEKNYREAIAAYEKTIKKYPKSDKVSSAMLKQGMAFLELGDNTAGKILLKKVVKTYPQSNQAKIAKSKLARIK